MKKFGTQKLRESGNALVVKLPLQWLATNGVKVSDPLFSVLTLDGIIRVHLEEVEWSKSALVRTIPGAPVLTLAAAFVTSLGLKKGSLVELSVDTAHDVLMIRGVA